MSDKLERLDYYTLLGVDPGVSPADLKRAFREFARRYHPDRFGEAPAKKRERATSIYRRGSEAYQVLGDPRTRQVYDEVLRQGRLRLDAVTRDRAIRGEVEPSAQRPASPPIASPQAKLYFEKGVQAAHQGEWRKCWNLLRTALEHEPGNSFIESRLEQVKRQLRG